MTGCQVVKNKPLCNNQCHNKDNAKRQGMITMYLIYVFGKMHVVRAGYKISRSHILQPSIKKILE